MRPIRHLPVWLRYLITALLVLLCFSVRYALEGVYSYPFLFFIPGIVAASFIFDRGSGFFATLFSTALAIYFFIEPRTTFVIADVGSVIAVAAFLATGLLIASVIEALRVTVEELMESERRLGDNLNLLEGIFEGTPDPMFVKDRDGHYVQVNSALARAFGAPVNVIVGRRDRDFLPAQLAMPIEDVDAEIMKVGTPQSVEEMISVAGRGARWFLTTKAPWYSASGEVIGIVGIAQDIDERKRSEDQVRTANSQKEILLHDINHRVKNHIQSVMSLLAMSRRRISDEVASRELESAVSRLGVLARVYDRLQVKGDASAATVALRPFVEGLCDEIGPAVIGLRPVVLRVHVEDMDLDAGRAVSLGLAVNELVQNSLKHAFGPDETGSVEVRLERLGDLLVLTVTDDGAGLPAGRADKTGVGTRLVRALAQQLSGTVEWNGASGTRVVLQFPAVPEQQARVGSSLP